MPATPCLLQTSQSELGRVHLISDIIGRGLNCVKVQSLARKICLSQEFHDVTLVVEDNQQTKVYNIILKCNKTDTKNVEGRKDKKRIKKDQNGK